ncbi:hypothetical protein ACS3SW_08560 [Roseobacteraceae bacterium S113]
MTKTVPNMPDQHVDAPGYAKSFLNYCPDLPPTDQLTLSAAMLMDAARKLAGDVDRAQVAELVLMSDRLDRMVEALSDTTA